ncbi:MAG: hypothetical protein K2H52_02215 [Lachnospiraceae bacterium]|nr:hypothetical protein [Lachnospiraceae bacterium]MDE6184290.1 hypothetical protein [Lachnospiraceae bacterium]MDE7286947.1 hypothetical protein [Lachnospiraceae bacterium]
MKKMKLFAPFVTLLAGAVASLIMYYFHYSTQQMLTILLLVLFIFYLAASFIQGRLAAFVSQIKAQEEHEREVMEMQAALEAEGESTNQANEEIENGAE